MNVVESKNKIITIFSILKTNVEMSNIAGYYDIDREFENIIAKLLNYIYEYKFINANEKKKNFPAVDLIDDENKIAVQVTADNSYEKINKTFDVYWNSNKKLYEKYKIIKFFMLKGKKGKYDNDKIINSPSSFNTSTDIIDYFDLIKELDKLSPNKMLEMATFLESQYISQIIPRLSNITKLTVKDTKLDNYIERFVINSQSTNYNQEKLLDVVKENNKVILLSDAGKGKTLGLKKLMNDFNMLNDGGIEYFPIYYRLNTYVNEEILTMIPKEYKNIYLKNIVFILDGFDEIEEKNKRTFIRKIESFSKENEDVKIIISCRKNFYMNKIKGFDGTITGFEEYYMCDIVKENIDEFLYKRNIDKQIFWNEINFKKLYYIIYNPFYLNEITEIFLQDKVLPSREELMEHIINRSFMFDNNKYKNTIDLEQEKDKLKKLLEKIALTLEYLGKNYLTVEEYNELVTQSENKELLKYSSLWIKENNERYSFVHNNFGEYLAAEKISRYPLNKIKEIVTYKKIDTKIKPSWINTLTFLVNKYKDNELIEWIISCMPEFITYVEDNIISIQTKKKVLRILLETYNNQKIWLPYHIRTNHLISNKEDIEYLLEIIKNNIHFTNVGNALNILENTDNLYKLDKEIKDVLMSTSKGNKYTTYNKSVAINILADFKLGGLNDLLDIIEKNKLEENSTLRKSYFYFCNVLGIVNNSLNIFIERWDFSKNTFRKTDDEEDIYSGEEHQEFCKAFNNISNPDTLKEAIQFIEKMETISYNHEDEIIINVCNSIFNTYSNTNKIIESLLEVYIKIEEKYSYANMSAIINIVKSKNLLLDFFKEYLKLEHKCGYRIYENIIDDTCMKYYYYEYKKGKYSDEVTELILKFTNRKIMFYEELKKLYEKKTKKQIIRYVEKDYKKIRKDSEKIFIDSLFDKSNFIKLFKDFVQEYGENDSIDLETLKDIRRYDKIESNVKYKELLYFLCAHFKENDKININSFDLWDWNFVLLNQIYERYIDSKEEIQLEENQIEVIHNICNRGIKKCNFRTALKNNRINLKCLYFWFFRNKFNFIYPEEILLDMLEFEFSTNGEKIGFNYIIENVDKSKVLNRIKENLNNKSLYYQVLENHIKYCIDNNIDDCCENVGYYLMNRKRFETDRNLAAKYLIKFMKLEDFIEKYFINLEIKMQRNIISMIIEKDKEILYKWLLDRLNKTRKIENKMFYAQNLIACNKVEGIEYYYKYIEKFKKPYIDKNYLTGINEQLSLILNTEMLEPLIKLLEITLDPKFKDDSFHGIYNNIRKSIINIGKIDDANFYRVKELLTNIFNRNQNYKYIGQISYMIKDLENEFCANYLNKYTISEVKEILFYLDSNKILIDTYM